MEWYFCTLCDKCCIWSTSLWHDKSHSRGLVFHQFCDIIILMTIDRGFIFCSDEGYVAYVNNDCIWSSIVPPTRYPPTCRPGQTYRRTKGYSPIAMIFKSLYHCPVILFVVFWLVKNHESIALLKLRVISLATTGWMRNVKRKQISITAPKSTFSHGTVCYQL